MEKDHLSQSDYMVHDVNGPLVFIMWWYALSDIVLSPPIRDAWPHDSTSLTPE